MSGAKPRVQHGYRGARGFIERGGKTSMISVRLDHQTMEIVASLSAKENVSAATILRRFIEQGMSVSPEVK